MNKQSGFTLIELVVVIIILGILAATAVPKFVDLQADARASALTGVKGALESAATLTYSRAAIDGNEGLNDGSTEANGVIIAFGYPEASDTALIEAAGLATTDWTITGTAPVVIVAAGSPAGAALAGNAAECRVTYTEAADADSRPVITVIDDGC